MTISKRILLHTILLFCDFNEALTASAIRSDNSVIYDSSKDQKFIDAGTVVEYYKDHEVSSSQARENLRHMRESDFMTPAHCPTCTKVHLEYCHSPNLLSDHCCCNQSHHKGKFNDLNFFMHIQFKPRNDPNTEGFQEISKNRFSTAPYSCYVFLRNIVHFGSFIIRKNIQA